MTFFWTKTSPEIKLFGINNLYSVRSISLKVSIFIFKLCVLYAAAAAKLLQLCPTLCDPIDGSPPGAPGPGILQARTLEWVTISFSNA